MSETFLKNGALMTLGLVSAIAAAGSLRHASTGAGSRSNDHLSKLLLTKLNSATEATKFLEQLVALDAAYHPDDDPRDIVRPDGTEFFTPLQAVLMEKRMREAFQYLGDQVYDVLAEEIHRVNQRSDA